VQATRDATVFSLNLDPGLVKQIVSSVEVLLSLESRDVSLEALALGLAVGMLQRQGRQID
jgi:hypothetical protein